MEQYFNDTNGVYNEGSLASGIDRMVAVTHGTSKRAGWWKGKEEGELHPETVCTKLMLTVSEIAEAMEGHRKNLMDDKLPHRPMMEVELADALIRIGDLAGRMGFDLGGAVVEKLRYNKTRADHQPDARASEHGKKY